MSLLHLASFDDPYSGLLNPQFNNCKITGTLTVNNLSINTLTVLTLNVTNKLNITSGNQYALEINNTNNTSNTWIGSKVGCVSNSDNYVVSGNLSGNATIGAHNIIGSGIPTWSDLYSQTDVSSSLKLGPISGMPTSGKVIVNGNVNINGNYLINDVLPFPNYISLGGGLVSLSNLITYQAQIAFYYKPSIMGQLKTVSFVTTSQNSGQEVSIIIRDFTHSNDLIFEQTNINISNPTIFTGTILLDLPTEDSIFIIGLNPTVGIAMTYGNFLLGFI